ncbi:alpha/beta fold hydrolase [Novosphingobium sp. 18050]|uniref:S9 family peptidase n=1 Tax=unclassified Novosphingobium TaxID=2644732 RepID=UPI0034CDF996
MPTATAIWLAPAAALAAELIPLEAYGELPSVEDAAISPDGARIASVVQDEGKRSILVVGRDNEVYLRGATGETKVRSIDWADKDTLLVTNTATVSLGSQFIASKAELTGTVIVSLNGAASGMIFSKNKEIANTTRGRFGVRTIGGKTVGYFGGITLDTRGTSPQWRHGRSTLYAVDIATNRARHVAGPAGEDHYNDWLIDAAGNVAVTMDMSESTGTWRILGPDKRQLARGVDPTGNVSLVSFGKDGTTILYSIEDEDKNTRWFEAPLAGGETSEFLPGIAIDRLFVDRGTGRLLGYRSAGEGAETRLYDPTHHSAVTRILKAFKGRETHLVDWSPDFAEVLVRTDGNGDSGTWYLVDVKARHASPIGFERTAIPADAVGPVSLVDYTAQDGLTMNGVLTLPPGRNAKNLPVILLPHGGPSSRSDPGFDWWAQAFASRGYAVLQPNFRGSTNRDDVFRRAGFGEWGRKMQTDISDGLAELARRGVVDPKRACIVGASYGGYAALAGVTLQQGLYRCAVSVAGVADVMSMYNTDVRESGNSRMTWKSLREQLGDPKTYAEISPRRFAAKADAPVLLIHGKDDTVVPIAQSRAMADALKDAGKPYEMVVLNGEDHWLSRGDTRKQMLAETMRFVLKHNPVD